MSRRTVGRLFRPMRTSGSPDGVNGLCDSGSNPDEPIAELARMQGATKVEWTGPSLDPRQLVGGQNSSVQNNACREIQSAESTSLFGANDPRGLSRLVDH